MSDVIIVGDGPAGLSAALLLAKNGNDVDVFGTDDTPMHKAMLYNYPGIEEITGSEFQRIARGQAESFGAEIHDTRVESVDRSDGGFSIRTDDDETFEADYLILATSNKSHQKQIGVQRDGGVAAVDRNGRTNIDRCYAIGWASRTDKIQAVISAGDGAAAAVDILSDQKGEAFHDFDFVDD